MEKRVEIDGKTYVSKEATNLCSGCAFLDRSTSFYSCKVANIGAIICFDKDIGEFIWVEEAE